MVCIVLHLYIQSRYIGNDTDEGGRGEEGEGGGRGRKGVSDSEVIYSSLDDGILRLNDGINAAGKLDRDSLEVIQHYDADSGGARQRGRAAWVIIRHHLTHEITISEWAWLGRG